MKVWSLVISGWVCTGLAFLGLFLPVLPTVPFLLLAMFCFSRSSPRFQHWLETNRYLGPTVLRLKEKQGLTRKEKTKILIYSWLSIGATILFLLERPELKVLLASILAILTVVIIRYKTHNASNLS